MSILRGTLTPDNLFQDVSWASVSVSAWTTAELFTGVLIASLSTLRPLVAHYIPGFSMPSSNQHTTATARASYGLQRLTNKTTARRADSKSAIMSRSSRFSKNGWIDLSEPDREGIPSSSIQGTADVEALDTAQLESRLSYNQGTPA